MIIQILLKQRVSFTVKSDAPPCKTAEASVTNVILSAGATNNRVEGLSPGSFGFARAPTLM